MRWVAVWILCLCGAAAVVAFLRPREERRAIEPSHGADVARDARPDASNAGSIAREPVRGVDGASDATDVTTARPAVAPGAALVCRVVRDGAPVAGAVVSVERRSVGVTGDDGTLVADLAPIWRDLGAAIGWIEVAASDEHGVGHRLVDPRAGEIVLALSEPPRVVAGVVRVADTGVPAAGIDVRIGDVAARTGVDGSFELRPPEGADRAVLERDGVRLAEEAVPRSGRVELVVPPTSALVVEVAAAAPVGPFDVELHGRVGNGDARLAAFVVAAGEPLSIDVPQGFDGYTLLASGPGHLARAVELATPPPAHVRVELDAAPARVLHVPGARGTRLEARVTAWVLRNLAVEERVVLDEDGSATLVRVGDGQRMRVALGTTVAGTHVPLACAVLDVDGRGPIVVDGVDVAPVTLDVAGDGGAVLIELEPAPAGHIERACPYGNALGAPRRATLVASTPARLALVVPRGELAVGLVDLASARRAEHRLVVDGPLRIELPVPPPAAAIDLSLSRGATPLASRRFRFVRAGEDDVSGVTDASGRARVALPRDGTWTLLVEGDEGLVAGSRHEVAVVPATREVHLDVPAPARVALAGIDVWSVRARPLGRSPDFYVGEGRTVRASRVDERLSAGVTLALSAGRWELFVRPDGDDAFRVEVELAAGELRTLVPPPE